MNGDRQQQQVEDVLAKMPNASTADMVASIISNLDSLTDEQRHAVFCLYCSCCGGTTPHCQCWNDI